jgi:hypothetical protein
LLELPWNPAVMEQRISRIHRPGQKDPIDVFHLVSENSIESRIAGLVGQKRAVFNALFDGSSESVLFDRSTSFLSQMRALYEDERPAPRPTKAQRATADAADEPLDIVEDLPASAASEPSTTLPTAPPDEAPETSAAFRVVRRPDGGLSIDVPPALAPALASVFASLADALRGSAP